MFSRTWNCDSKDFKKRVLIYKEKFLYSLQSIDMNIFEKIAVN